MVHVKIYRQLATEHLQAAAELYALAFERESVYFFGDKKAIITIFPHIVNRDQVLTMVSEDNELLGITGFSFLHSPLLGVQLSVMQQVYGYWNGLVRYIRWRLFFSRSFPAQHMYIDAVTVKEGYRGHGLVRYLLQEAERVAIAKGMIYIELDVVDDNMPAFQAYKKEGFSKVKSYLLPKRYTKIFQIQKVTNMVKVLEQNWLKIKA